MFVIILVLYILNFISEILYALFLNMRLKCTLSIYTRQNNFFFLMQAISNLVK